MQFHTYNGVFAEEQKLGQRLQIDVELRLPIETQVQHSLFLPFILSKIWYHIFATDWHKKTVTSVTANQTN